MSNRVANCFMSPINFIRGIRMESFRQRERIDFPSSGGLNFICFSWLTDWILLKSHQELTDDELPSVDPVDKDLSKVETLEAILDKQTKLLCEGLFGKLNIAVYITYWKSFLMLIILGLLRDIMEFCNVLLLKTILKNMQNEDAINNKFLSGLVTTTLCILQIVDIFFDTHFFFYYYRLEIRIETTLGALICKRALYNPAGVEESIENCNIVKSNEGANLLNLQLFDIENASWGVLAITDLLLTPVRVAIIATWMYNQVGNASTTSTLIVGLITLLMCLLQIKSSSLVKLYLKKLDSRVVETKNILGNIRTLRLIRWMEYSKEAILTSRTRELQICNKRAYLYAVSNWLGSVLPYIVSLVTFVLYLMEKTPDLSLDASVAIPLMHTITYLIRPMKHLSGHLADHLSGIASLRRISKYLNLHSNNRADDANIHEDVNTVDKANDVEFEKKLIKLVKNGGVTVITGLSQGNKLEFLSQLESRIIKLDCECILTTPTSWLPSGTIRSVITFFRPYNELIYNRIVSACGLTDDFDSWEDGDHRTIDERGGSLSTGQRTRIAMARSIYYQEIKGSSGNSPLVQLIGNVFSVLDPSLACQVFWSLFTNLDDPGILSNSTCFVLMDEKLIKHIYQLKPASFNLALYNYQLDPVPLGTILDVFPKLTYSNLDVRNMKIEDIDSLESPKSILLDTPRKKIKNHAIPESDTSTPQLPLLQRYSWYLRHVGYFPLSILVFCTVSSAMAHVISDFIIGKWSSAGSQEGRMYLYLFTLFTSLTIVFDLCKCFYQAIGNLSGAKNTYESSVSGVLCSPMTFYDSMPLGRIINRLSTDQNYVDQSLFHRFCEVTSALSSITLILLSLCYLNPICIVIFPFFVLLVYCWVFKHYMGINKEIMKRTLRKRSPLCTICNQCIDGESVIRSFKVEKFMYQNYLDSLLEYQRMRFIKISSASWALLRLRVLSLPLEFASAVLTPFRGMADRSILKLDPTPRVGLALSYSFAFAKLTRQLINTIVQLETEMCCASRLQELSISTFDNIYTNADQSNVFTTAHKSLSIEFPPNIENFTDIHTLTNDKYDFYNFGRGLYGIVGRTGAGKSTLLNYISGIIPFDGKIQLDGVNISTLSDDVLGDIVGVIPHEMPMITGWSIRNYVNPRGIYPDYLIHDSLHKSGLTYFIRKLESEDPLSTVIMDKDNSVKSLFTPLIIQYISVARLILHSKLLRVVLVDEPRQSIKSGLPPIGQIINEYLHHCTTFIIAHHITSLETCKSIYLVELGRIVKSLPIEYFKTQQDLAMFIN
ncbi:orthologous to PfMRP, ABC transporter protein involved in chloroquine and quinine resistance [Babesia microti strain RI]|uniref:Orthologous to PfMRP, ABC transporter protein involved in chloroquine and quinine resistance n=1 Tax=Babesia microti (strain RI) TaxID=1133968 RepID=A0A1R4AAB1_BABMR|nr:orthologous to PfMRP, ABC transporter protein involved in chloroquine and quinine resistance [Babesia microti strain RI]SJK85949.1 orthologous to PfMRP, ABC transporter protein involved in chloroquine and quinine resistance [Babesia microti strain RI]|eukprot:XP_021338154.1 orthologous to PfMRP, ABC transporter protein involved in chloroquine and quinine resistance [Babesia microti strain RI]